MKVVFKIPARAGLEDRLKEAVSRYAGDSMATVNSPSRGEFTARSSAGNRTVVRIAGDFAVVEFEGTRHAIGDFGNVAGLFCWIVLGEPQSKAAFQKAAEAAEVLEVQTSATDVPWYIAGAPRFRLEALGFRDFPEFNEDSQSWEWAASSRAKAHAMGIRLPRPDTVTGW